MFSMENRLKVCFYFLQATVVLMKLRISKKRFIQRVFLLFLGPLILDYFLVCIRNQGMTRGILTIPQMSFQDTLMIKRNSMELHWQEHIIVLAGVSTTFWIALVVFNCC